MIRLRCLPLLAALLALALPLSGCTLTALIMLNQNGKYSDDYEQAIIDLLDASPVVREHEVVIDFWEDQPILSAARVFVAPSASADEVRTLIDSVADLRSDRTVPSLRFQTPDDAEWTGAGQRKLDICLYREIPGGATDGVVTAAAQVGWAINGCTDRLGATTRAQSAAEARELLAAPASAVVRDHAFHVRIYIPTLSRGRSWAGNGTLPQQDMLDFLIAAQQAELDPAIQEARLHIRTESRVRFGGAIEQRITVDFTEPLDSGAPPSGAPNPNQPHIDACDNLLDAATQIFGRPPDQFVCRAGPWTVYYRA